MPFDAITALPYSIQFKDAAWMEVISPLPGERIVTFLGARPVAVVGQSPFSVPSPFTRAAEGWDRIGLVSTGPFISVWSFVAVLSSDDVPFEVKASVEWVLTDTEDAILCFAARPEHEIERCQADVRSLLDRILATFASSMVSNVTVRDELGVLLPTLPKGSVALRAVKVIQLEAGVAVVRDASVNEVVERIKQRDELAALGHEIKRLEIANLVETLRSRAMEDDRERRAKLDRSIRFDDAKALLDILSDPNGRLAVFPDSAFSQEIELRRLDIALAEVRASVERGNIQAKDELLKQLLEAFATIGTSKAENDILKLLVGQLQHISLDVSDGRRGRTNEG